MNNTYYNLINDFCLLYNCNKNSVITNNKIGFRYFCYKYLDGKIDFLTFFSLNDFILLLLPFITFLK